MNDLIQHWLQWASIFGADRIETADLSILQEKAPNIVAYALPLVGICTVIEFAGSYFGTHKTYESKETMGSLFVGLGNLMVNLLMKTVLVFGAVWIYNLLPWRMELNWWTLIACFICYDCCSYWSHRISHFNRFFWATHVVHHSAEYYNLTVAFRQSWVQHFKTVFFIPVAMMGFHPVVFLLASQLSTLYQFWVHTETIGKLHPWIEKYLGTPSNHRVHHGSQEKYLDKNFGATFMIWDHLFGTFQYEKEQPVYGLTTPLKNKTNPLVLNFHEYRDMLKDLQQSDGLKQCLFFIFASPAKIYKYKLNAKRKPEQLHHGNQDSRQEELVKNSVIVLMFLILWGEALNANPLRVLPAKFGQVGWQQSEHKQLQTGNLQDQPVLPVPKRKDLLFFLQRTPDANTVIYELNYQSDGILNPNAPIKGSWIRYEEHGRVKALGSIEKRFAYGVKCRQIGNDEYEIRLAAYKKLPLYLLKSEKDNKYHIYIKDEGRNLLLKRVFVKVNGGLFWAPKVTYIDLITTNSETGIEILKRIDI